MLERIDSILERLEPELRERHALWIPRALLDGRRAWPPDPTFELTPSAFGSAHIVGRRFPDMPCIYAFHAYRRGVFICAYVGQTTRLQQRYRAHRSDGASAMRAAWGRFSAQGWRMLLSVWALRCACELNTAENSLMLRLHPVLNRGAPPRRYRPDCRHRDHARVRRGVSWLEVKRSWEIDRG